MDCPSLFTFATKGVSTNCGHRQYRLMPALARRPDADLVKCTKPACMQPLRASASLAVCCQTLELCVSLTGKLCRYLASAHTLEAAYTGEGGIGKSPPAEATSRMDPAWAMQTLSMPLADKLRVLQSLPQQILWLIHRGPPKP